MSKNGEGREFKFTAELRTLLETRRAEHDRLQKAGDICPLVFVRLVAKGRRGPKSPKPIQSFMKRWRRACALAGCPGSIPHDLRRSAVPTFAWAGVTEHVVMKLSGHKTPSVFRPPQHHQRIGSQRGRREAGCGESSQYRDSCPQRRAWRCSNCAVLLGNLVAGGCNQRYLQLWRGAA